MEAGRASASTTHIISTGRDKSNQAAGYGNKLVSPQRAGLARDEPHTGRL
jgi:hypothetical protein